jgi:gas vesicle protein GvpL/GvpF
MTGSATYAYAISRPITAADLRGLRGVDDAPVRVVGARDVRDMVCLVSTVDLTEFGEEPLRRNLEDLEWLERTARRHDDVVRAVAGLATAVPLRLATIFADDASVRRRLVEWGSRANAALNELDGRDEWGVKLFAVADPPREQAEPADDAASGSSSGVAYLQRRRQQLDRRAARTQLATQEAEWLHGQLARRAARAHRHRPQDQRLSGVAQPMLLNAAYLVDRDRADGFRHAVEELAGDRPPGSVVVTGPWPPYSFAPVEDG